MTSANALTLDNRVENIIKRLEMNVPNVRERIVLHLLKSQGFLTSSVLELDVQEKDLFRKLFFQLNHDTGELLLKYPIFSQPKTTNTSITTSQASTYIAAGVYDIQKYRDVFKGYRVGSMGDKKACKSKMDKWLKDNEEYSFEQVIEAAEYYIKSLQNDYKYLQQADYFIMKDKQSRLSAIIDDVVGDNTMTSNQTSRTKLR